jgi:hypothetical protein
MGNSSHLTRAQFLARSLKSGLGLLAAGSLAGVASRPASAEIPNQYFAMFANVGGAPRPGAHVEVGVDTALGRVDVSFKVFDRTGAQVGEFDVLTNESGFASSQWAQGPNRNLFRLTNGEPGLVKVDLARQIDSSVAALVQRGQGSRFRIGLPRPRRLDLTPVTFGMVFSIALGDFAAATLLVGNISGRDASVDVYPGRRGAQGTGKYTNPRLLVYTVWQVDLEPSDQSSHLLVYGDTDLVVQLVVDDGRPHGITCLPTL